MKRMNLWAGKAWQERLGLYANPEDDPIANLNITVENEDGDGIKSALITLTNVNDSSKVFSATSDEGGACSILGITPKGDYNLKITHSDYKTKEAQIEIKKTFSLAYVLEAKDPEPPQEDGPIIEEGPEPEIEENSDSKLEEQ